MEQSRKTIPKFVEWLKEQTTTKNNYAKIIKLYEAYRVNEQGVKPQSSGAGILLLHLRDGLPWVDVSLLHKERLRVISENTNLSKRADSEQQTLTDWLEKMPWIRRYLDEPIYRRIASPKRLIASLTPTLSRAMLEIDKIAQELSARFKATQFDLNDLPKGKDTNVATQKWPIILLQQLLIIDDNGNLDAFSKQLFEDFVTPSCREYVLSEFKLLGVIRRTMSINPNDIFDRISCITRPSLFSYTFVQMVLDSTYGSEPEIKNSELEETCFAYLMGWQTIQSSNIPDLCFEHFLFFHDKNGISGILVDYYKTRAKKEQHTNILPARSIEGQAILRFLQKAGLGWKKDETPVLSLINRKGNKLQELVTGTSNLTTLFRLLSHYPLGKRVIESMNSNNELNIIIPIFKAIIDNKGEHPNTYKHRNRKKGNNFSIENYFKDVKNPTPHAYFSPNVIKNTSIHARSDEFRDGELMNTNSHSNTTEMNFYITPSNIEWKNRKGRLMRLIMEDIANNIYQPMLKQVEESIKEKAEDMKARTEAVTRTTGNVNTIGLINKHNTDDLEHNLPDQIFILDTPETVVNILSYLEQASNSYKNLLRINPLFVERELLPTCEYLEWVMGSKLKKENIRKGRAMFSKYSAFLPKLFQDQLRG